MENKKFGYINILYLAYSRLYHLINLDELHLKSCPTDDCALFALKKYKKNLAVVDELIEAEYTKTRKFDNIENKEFGYIDILFSASSQLCDLINIQNLALKFTPTDIYKLFLKDYKENYAVVTELIKAENIRIRKFDNDD